jgi:hypothetical protein
MMNKQRKATFGIALLLVLVFASVPAVLGFEVGGHGQNAALDLPASFSGDDAYDPAAGGTPELSVVARSLPQRAAPTAAATFSGDDLYDLAAGATPEISVAGSVWSSGSGIACILSDDEIAARDGWSVAGGYSGDDAYDSAAGGTPELSLLAFAEDVTLLASCEPAAFGF